MFEIADDYLAAASHIETALSSVPGVFNVAHLNNLTELDNITRAPALFYLYYGDHIDETVMAGNNQKFRQTWLVIVVDRMGERAQSGKLIANTIRALAGKRTGPVGPWKRVNTPIKPKYDKSHGYYPLAFTTEMRIKGAKP
ncbi:hypothetical protein MHM93_15295 [Pseudoalteromonas sp. MM17-2]|uniref:phage tail terminator protein n=1 Tax=Pseudoalteromonas TaxID=53246 RepID=UPI000349BE05|nr:MULTISPECIES: hypothetical protein [Pseudoalteromonas]MCG7545547.1 hypothetical protein [Pseudoalteromonas sp. MM17-2]